MDHDQADTSDGRGFGSDPGAPAVSFPCSPGKEVGRGAYSEEPSGPRRQGFPDLYTASKAVEGESRACLRCAKHGRRLGEQERFNSLMQGVSVGFFSGFGAGRIAKPRSGCRLERAMGSHDCPGGDNPIASHATAPALARWPACGRVTPAPPPRSSSRTSRARTRRGTGCGSAAPTRQAPAP